MVKDKMESADSSKHILPIAPETGQESERGFQQPWWPRLLVRGWQFVSQYHRPPEYDLQSESNILFYYKSQNNWKFD